MNCMKKFRLFLSAIVTIALVLGGMLAGCTGQTSTTENDNNYAVEVSGVDANINVSVQLINADGTIKTEKPLKDGKVVFDNIQQGEYVVNLTGVSEDYTYNLARLSENDKTANIQLKQSKRVNGVALFAVGVFVFDSQGKAVEVDPYAVQLCGVDSCQLPTNENMTSLLNFDFCGSGEFHFILNEIEKNYTFDTDNRYAILTLDK